MRDIINLKASGNFPGNPLFPSFSSSSSLCRSISSLESESSFFTSSFYLSSSRRLSMSFCFSLVSFFVLRGLGYSGFCLSFLMSHRSSSYLSLNCYKDITDSIRVINYIELFSRLIFHLS